MRRKYDDESSCSDLYAVDGSSQTDSRASDSRASRGSARKRRRTIVDAFQSISLNNQQMQTEEEEEEPEDDSSLLAGGPGTGEDDNSLTSASDDEQLMSDAEKAQRKIMLELVYAGKAKAPPPVNPVDAKVENLIRESMRRAASGSPPIETSADDMTLDTCYNSTMSAMSDLSLPGVRPRSNSLPSEFSQSDKGSMDTS